MAEQTKKRSMTTDTTSKTGENSKKKKLIRRSDEGKHPNIKATDSKDTLDLWEVWSCNYCLPPLGVAKENETDL